MVKLVREDDHNDVLAEGHDIYEIVERLNSGEENGNEWFYVFRPSAYMVNGYLNANEEEAEADYDGEKADWFGDIIGEPDPWYAVESGPEDNDWGTGSYDLKEAIEMAKKYGDGAQIAVINNGPDPVCERVILADEFDSYLE